MPLSLAPGTTLRGADVGHRRDRAEAEERGRAWRAARLPVSGAERRQQRARRPPAPSAAGWCRCARSGPRRSAICGQRRVEDEAGVGGVVVGDEDDRALGVGVAELADDVVGGALGEEAAQPPLARAGSRRRCRRRRPRRAASPSRRRPRSASDRAERAQRGADPQRPPVGAVGGLGLDPRLGAELGEARDQPLGGPALAVGGGRPVDPLQFLEPLPQPIRFARPSARDASRLPWADARRWVDHPLPRPRDQGQRSTGPGSSSSSWSSST